MQRQSLLGRLLSYLSRADTATDKPARTPAVRPSVEPATPQQFGNRVDQLLTEQNPVVGGKIQLLNLQPLHERYKDRWSRVADAVHRHVTNILRRRLSPQDAFTKNTDDTYLIVFANLSEEQAQLKCAILAREILEKLQGGDEASAQIGVQAVVATLSGKVGLEARETLDRVKEALERAEPAASAEKTGNDISPARDPLAALLASFERKLQELGSGAAGNPKSAQQAIYRLCELASQAQAELTAIAHDPAARGSPGWVDMLRDRATKIVDAADAIRTKIERDTGVPAIPTSNDDIGIEFSYRPVWQTRRGVVTTYRCELTVRISDVVVRNDDIIPNEDGVAIATAMDRLVLRQALKDLATGVEEQRPTVVMIPVHYLTIARQLLSSSYLRTVHEVPEKLRHLIVWEVLEAPTGTWTGQIFTVLSTLKRFGRAVIVRVPIETPSVRELVAIGAHAVGLDLRTCEQGEAALIKSLERFVAMTEKAGMQAYVLGAAKLSVAEAVVAAGFDYVAGDAVADPVKFPAGVVPSQLQDLYERNLRIRANSQSTG